MEHLQPDVRRPPLLGNLSRQYLTLRVARKDFAMEAEHVRGILPTQDLVQSEGGQSDLIGFIAFAGRMVPVLDAATRLGLRYASRGSRPKIVIVEHPEGMFSGFIADRVADVVTYRSRDLRNGVLHGLGRPRRLILLEMLAPGRSVEELLLLRG